LKQVQLYDTTLRDGAQQQGITFSVEDKLKIARKLDELGIHYIEGGWPGSNPKDAEFFDRVRDLRLSQAVICAFGSTRRMHTAAADDGNLKALLEAGTPVVTLVGKSSELQVTRVLETTLEENLAMIRDSIGFLKSKGLTVFFDAEHFFDGYKANRDYTLSTVKAAAEAGADCIIPCDTNGGTLPYDVAAIMEAVGREVDRPLGIHAHNDAEVAKMGVDCISDEQLAKLSDVARYVSELANLAVGARKPYVGGSAFAHKGGLHVSAMAKWDESYQHIDPELVGNRSGVLVSELSGISNIVYKARERGLDLPPGDEARRILEHIKLMESRGFQYEDAEASFDLLVYRAQPDYHPPFELVDFMVMVEKRRRPAATGEEMLAEAMVKIRVDDQVVHTAAEGNGPVDCLDKALRKALLEFYPSLAQVRLSDYKVRILDESAGTEAQVRVLIESTDGGHEWITVGSSTNIIEASWLALADSLEYWLLRRGSSLQG